MQRRHSLRLLLFLAVLLPLAGCGLANVTGPPPIATELNVPKAFMRDIVRDGAMRSDGTPLFTEIDLGYDFERGLFHVEGTYIAPDGSAQQGFADLAFAVQDAQIVATIADHDIAGIDDDLATLNENITAELRAFLGRGLEQEILSVERVRVEGSDLMVGVVHEGIDNVVPLN